MIIIKETLDINRIINKLPRTAEIYTSTFNISTWNKHGPAQTLLQEFNLRKTHLIVGVPKYMPCTGQYGIGSCKRCYQRYEKTIKTLSQLKTQYNNIDWKFTNNLHSKYIVTKPLAIIGGRNITDSKIQDLSFVEKDSKLCDQLIQVWHENAAQAYDIGTEGPLVFTSPYNGEMMANSTNITDEYKNEIIKNYPNYEVAIYWAKNKSTAG